MYEELKIVAELAKSGGFEIGSAYSEDRYYAFDEIAYIDFAEKATPSAVLALIAENERFERETKRVNASWHGMKRDLDKLKAENARSTEREILQLAEIESLRKVIKDVWLTTPGQAGAGDISRLQRTYADVGRIILGISKDANQ